jgi:hypothetical protein
MHLRLVPLRCGRRMLWRRGWVLPALALVQAERPVPVMHLPVSAKWSSFVIARVAALAKQQLVRFTESFEFCLGKLVLVDIGMIPEASAQAG